MLLFAFAVMFAAPAEIDSFRATSDDKNITIEWRSSKETSIARYEIERSAANQNEYKNVGSIDPKGSQNYYRFVDESAFMRANGGGGSNTASGTLYSYRIKMVGNDNQVTLSNAITVTHSVSSVRKTWGMLKEMFR